MSEGRQWLDHTLAQLHGRTASRAKVLRVTAIIAAHQGDSARATSLVEESLDVWRTLGDTKGIASALLSLGGEAQQQGDYEQATIRFLESLPLLREAGDKQGAALVLTSLGLTVFYQGNHERARALYEESLALFRELGDIRGIAAVLTNLGMMHLEQGEHEHATRLCEESLVFVQSSSPSMLSTMVDRPHPFETLSNNQLQQLEYCSLLERALTNGDNGAVVECRQWFANKLVI